jgi:hypothetical protein
LNDDPSRAVDDHYDFSPIAHGKFQKQPGSALLYLLQGQATKGSHWYSKGLVLGLFTSQPAFKSSKPDPVTIFGNVLPKDAKTS